MKDGYLIFRFYPPKHYRGLTSDSSVDLKQLAFAALKSFFADIALDDISATKLLERRPRNNSRRTNTAHTPALTSNSSSTRQSHPSPPLSPSGVATVVSKLPPRLLVHLKSPSTAVKIIEAKIRVKAVKTDSIDRNLLTAAGCAPLPSSTLNVNEFLPPRIHYISRLTHMKAREKNFISFVRNGRVYTRKRTDQRSTPINVASDLCNFLAILRLTST